MTGNLQNLLLYLSRAINVIWIIIVQFQLFLQWLKSVFERIVYNQLFSYLNERINILSNHQSGFRSLHSTMTTLLEATDNWALNIDRGFVNTACCISRPQKSFRHYQPIHLIVETRFIWNQRKCSRPYLFLLYSYNRTQKCSVNGLLSESRSLTCGIPQGTILGPLLFLLYINDLPNCLSNSEPRIFVRWRHSFKVCR